MNIDELFTQNKLDSGPECKGLVFRGFENLFWANNRLERKEGIKLLKRKSCSGCPKCGWLLDSMSEQVSNGTTIIMSNIENGKEYSLRVINEHRDWETGYVDDYDIEVYLLDNSK